MANYVTNAFLGRQMGDSAQISSVIDFENDTFKAMLLTSSHTPDIDAEVFIDDVSSNEVSTSGSYTSGAGNGFSVTMTGSTDDTNDLGAVDAADLQATSITTTARYLAIYKWTGSASTSPIVFVFDFGSNVTAVSGTLDIVVASAGLATLSTS